MQPFIGKKRQNNIMANNNVKKGEPQSAEQPLISGDAFIVKYKKAIIGVVAAIVIVVVAAVLYTNYVARPRETKASTMLAKSQQMFDNQMYNMALNGDSVSFGGFLQVADEYSGTAAGNLANLYAGLCYAQLGQWEQAATYIEKFKGKGDKMISPAAQGALGNVYAHTGNLDKAVELLKKAAGAADNNSLSPTFLIQAGEILESQGKTEEALKMYQEVKDKYFNSVQYQTIDKYIERVTK